MLLDEVQPDWHFRERHGCRVSASTEAVFAAVHGLTWREVPVFRFLMATRALFVRRPRQDRPILADMADIGFAEIARSGAELVYGAVGRPWSPSGGVVPIADEPDPAAAYQVFDEPGWARMAMNFRFVDGVLSTETRVWLTDPRSRRRFRAYWTTIRPFSGLIRRTWLAAIRGQAESAGRPGGLASRS